MPAEELTFALTATTLQLFAGGERVPSRVLPLEDVRTLEPVDGRPRGGGGRSWEAHVVTAYHTADHRGETRSLRLRLSTQQAWPRQPGRRCCMQLQAGRTAFLAQARDVGRLRRRTRRSVTRSRPPPTAHANG